MEGMNVVVSNQRSAHVAVTHAYALAKQLVLAGKKVRITASEEEDDRTLQQNRFYWGPVLGEISEQAAINGQRYAVEAWHELFKRQFLGYEVKKVAVAGRRKKTVYRRLRSTSELKVRAMGEYLDKVQAFAAADLGVQFSVRRWQEFRG